MDEIKIEYERPKTTTVIFSQSLDFLFFCLICLVTFIPCKAIIQNTTVYKTKNSEFDSLKVESNLYIYYADESRVTDIVTYYNSISDASQSYIENDLSNRIDKFYTFMINETSEETLTEIKKTYDDFRLSVVTNNKNYFIKNDEKVIKNSAAAFTSKEYVENVYKTYIDNYALGQFIGKGERALTYQKYFSNFLFLVEVPISLFVGLIVVYYIFPLIFSRGKKTLGKLIYKIGVVNKNILSPTFSQFTINFLLFFFLEALLSIFIFCIPIIISFTMEIFTKKKQNFHNYMTNFSIISTSAQKIYKSKDEIVLERTEESEPKKIKLK